MRSQKACIFIYNPLSGGFSPQQLASALDFLAGQGFAPILEEACDPETAARLAQEACREQDSPFLIIAAGDGTINSVVNGLEPGKATLAVVPFGTSNVLARELGIMSPGHALEKIAAGVSRPASVGHFEKGTISRYFLLMAGIGVDGFVVKGVTTREKRLFKKGAYVLSACRHVLNWERGHLEVATGTRVVGCHSVIICNAAKYGGNALLAPEASLFDPSLQVICICGETRMAYLKLLGELYCGKGLHDRSIVRFPAQRIDIRGTKPLQADGDYYLDSPVSISVVPNFMKLIV